MPAIKKQTGVTLTTSTMSASNSEEKAEKTIPASEILARVDAAWPRLTACAQTRAASGCCAGVDAVLKWASGGLGGPARPTALPALAVILIACYVIDAVVALFIDSTWAFVAWEEAFALATVLGAWVASTSGLRTYVAEELSSAMAKKRYDMQALNSFAAHAQSVPGIAVVMALVPLRLVFLRMPAFLVADAGLAIETACEFTFLLLVSAYCVYRIATASEKAVVAGVV